MSFRPERVADQLRSELSELLTRAVHDPGIGFVTLTRVRVTPDLQLARIYYTSLGSDDARRETERALRRAVPFLRHELGRRLRLRRVPELEFFFDKAVEGQARIEELIEEIHAADAEREREYPLVDRIRDEVVQRGRFLITSHLKPDGDSIGSQMAMAYALRELGKDVRVVNKDPAPAPLLGFPGVTDIQIADAADGEVDAVIVMECGDLARTGLRDLERYFIINIDHHPGNSHFGAINWFDATAAACGEMVFELVKRLNVRITPEIAQHIYLAILTDTGSFHFSNISSRTFDICRQAVDAGVDPPLVARAVFDNNNLGRLKLFGAVLSGMQLDPTGRLAVLYLDRTMALDAGGTYDDTEGLINLPLTVREIQAVVFFKEEAGEYRVSMRSKGDIDVGAVAKAFGGGGHKNASGCTLKGAYEEVKARMVWSISKAIDATA